MLAETLPQLMPVVLHRCFTAGSLCAGLLAAYQAGSQDSAGRTSQPAVACHEASTNRHQRIIINYIKE